MVNQDIDKCVGGTEDVFFDSLDLFSVDDMTDDEVFSSEIWRNQLRSVKERRDTFLYEMGFMDYDAGLKGMGVEKRVETGGVVSSSQSSTECEEENVVCSGRVDSTIEDNGEQDQSNRISVDICEDVSEPSTSCDHLQVCKDGESLTRRIGHWWKSMNRSGIKSRGQCKAKKGVSKKSEMSRKKVHVNRKKVKELSALFEAQDIRAHEGVIWTMKFSPDGQYLASAGQDRVVRVWRVKSVDSDYNKFSYASSVRTDEKGGSEREKKMKVPVVIPSKMFQIEEQPLLEFYGHTGDVLDLSWSSSSNCLLSSSMDKTVRLWRVGSDTCLSTFLHTGYVTCVQFNPVDDRYFISGSIDGKVRIWGVPKRRVLDWADVRDAVTALCYQPDGHGFVVGSLGGICRFYETQGDLVDLSAHIEIHSNKKSTGNRITGIQFLSEDSQRVMVMSEGSKLLILDKGDVICKYRGLHKSGGRLSASLTSNGRHIVSAGDHSRVYLWNHEEQFMLSSTTKKSRSCEHFCSEGVSVAVPWSGTQTKPVGIEYEDACRPINLVNFSVRNMFSSKSSAIWPQDVLPIFVPPEEVCQGPSEIANSSAWGLVIVTGNCDGVIRTFHNYGLPTKQ